jgi:hypothetical protein
MKAPALGQNPAECARYTAAVRTGLTQAPAYRGRTPDSDHIALRVQDATADRRLESVLIPVELDVFAPTGVNTGTQRITQPIFNGAVTRRRLRRSPPRASPAARGRRWR